MALPDTLERVGIVVGSALMGMLPVSTLLLVLVPDLSELSTWPVMVAWFLPGVAVGALVALDRLPVAYDEIWLFCILSWLVTFGLWASFGGSIPPAGNQFLAFAFWVVAVVFAGLVTWRREWLLGAVAADPEES